MKHIKLSLIKKYSILIGVLLIPVIYSFCYLKAYWNPYENVNKLPIAVVNLDAGTVTNGKSTNLGVELVDSLKKNNSLKCYFVGKNAAEKGVHGDQYYAAITIPKDFSQDVASASDNVKKNAKIYFEPNEQHNYIATMMLRSVTNVIVNNLKGKVDKSITANLVEQLQSVPQKLQTLNDNGLNKLASGAQSMQNGIGSVSNGQQNLNSGLVSLNSGLSTLSKGTAQLNDNMGTFSNGLKKTSKGINELNSGAQGLTKLNSGIAALNTAANTLSAGLSKLQHQFSSGSTSNLKYVADSLSNQSTGAPSYVKTVNSMVFLMRKNTEVYNSILISLAQAPDAASKQAYANALVLFTDTDNSVEVGRTIAVLSANGITSRDIIIAQQQKLACGGLAITQAVSVLETQFNASGAGQSPTLYDSVNQLSFGASQIAAGTSSLSNSVPQITQLQNGISSLNFAVQQLNSGADALYTGTQKLAAGSASASTGSNELVSGSGKMLYGLNSLYHGSSELTGGIDTASKSVEKSIFSAQSSLNATNGLDKYAQDPVSLKEQDVNLVSSYGIAFAPFFISLSLWIGGIMMFFGIHFDWLKRIQILTPQSKYTILRTFIFLVIGVFQAIILGGILQHTLNLNIANVNLYFGACILFSLVSVAIIQFLIVIMGDLGKLLTILMLIFSLTSSGGTFPTETITNFFASVNAFLPMTYSIDLLRQAIIQYHPSNANWDIAVELGWMAIFLVMTIVILAVKEKKAKGMENSGLLDEDEAC